MKTLGIIGGMSPASTITYYNVINRLVNEHCGQNHSAPLLLHSLDFQAIVECQKSGDWQQAGEILSQSAQKLVSAGAEGILLATNTMHKVAQSIIDAIDVPFLHIADATALAIKAKNIKSIALLGTAFTMQQDFYKQRLQAFGIEILVPDIQTQNEIHRIIFQELTLSKIYPKSKCYYLNAIEKMQQIGAEAVVLGCTEIGLLIQQNDVNLPIFDTTLIHAQAAANFILGL